MVHRLPGGIKLLGLILVSITLFFPGWPQGAGGLIILFGAICAKIRPWELLRGSAPLTGAGGAVVFLRSLRFNSGESGLFTFSPAGFIQGLQFWAGLLLAFSAGSLLFSVTTMTELRDSLSKAEALFLGKKRKKNLSLLSLSLSLMLGFLPRFFAIWEDAEIAYSARAGKKGVPKIRTLLPFCIERMVETAVETAKALEARGITI
jgi:energy-coupling factor transporter transmembrane protein EcfT